MGFGGVFFCFRGYLLRFGESERWCKSSDLRLNSSPAGCEETWMQKRERWCSAVFTPYSRSIKCTDSNADGAPSNNLHGSMHEQNPWQAIGEWNLKEHPMAFSKGLSRYSY